MQDLTTALTHPQGNASSVLHNRQEAERVNPYKFRTSGLADGPSPTSTGERRVARRRRDPSLDKGRGERARQIREVLAMSQYDMVDRLNATARSLGLPASYRYYTVSRMETGALGFEDALIYIALDPEQRGWEWFVTGKQAKDAKHASPALFTPAKRRASGR